MTENYFRPGKFNCTDYTFCENGKCKFKNRCARSLGRYKFEDDTLISVAYFDCDVEEIKNEINDGSWL